MIPIPGQFNVLIQEGEWAVYSHRWGLPNEAGVLHLCRWDHWNETFVEIDHCYACREKIPEKLLIARNLLNL